MYYVEGKLRLLLMSVTASIWWHYCCGNRWGVSFSRTGDSLLLEVLLSPLGHSNI